MALTFSSASDGGGGAVQWAGMGARSARRGARGRTFQPSGLLFRVSRGFSVLSPLREEQLVTSNPLGLCAPAGFPLREGRLPPAPAVAFPKDVRVPLNLTPPALLCRFSARERKK